MDPDCLPAVLVWGVAEEHAIDGIKAPEFELLHTLQYVLYMWYNMARKSNVQSGVVVHCNDGIVCIFDKNDNPRKDRHINAPCVDH